LARVGHCLLTFSDLISSGLHPVTMCLAPELEQQLQAAHLEALAPVLVALGVESIADVEFVKESDFENQKGVTVVKKRRFFEWTTKALDEMRRSVPTH